MEKPILSIEVEPGHIVEIAVHITEILKEQQRRNFITTPENDNEFSR
jgi:hypothetical protein